MSAPQASYDVIVVGGGVVGLSCAWRAALRGLDVAVVDPSPGRGASHVAAGMLAPVTEVHYGEEPLLRLNLAAAERYPSFVEELEAATGVDAGYRTCGTLAVALDSGDRAVLDDLHRFQRSLGLNSDVLTGRECRRLEPMLAPDVRGGLLVAGDHQVDNRRLVEALLAAVERVGVDVLRVRAGSVTVDDVARGVVLSAGEVLAAPNVVLATGARSGEVAGVPSGVLPVVRPVKGQIVRLRVPPAYEPFLSRTVRGVARGSHVYLVPRVDGQIVVGATTEERGFDDAVTAGGIYELLRDAHALLPGLRELPLVESIAGLRPGSPDNAPLIGESALPGLVVATGHYRNGILLGPLTGDVIASLLVEGALPEVARPFSPQRFATRTEVMA